MKPKKKRVVKPRVPRTHAGNTWTKAGFWGFIRSALRRAFSRYPVKYQAKLAARKTVKGERYKYMYLCAACEEWFQDKETEMDHIIACGSLKDYSDLPGFVERLFCEPKDLQILCKPCHKIKTAEDRSKT